MGNKVIQLYPLPSQEFKLEGLYLDHNLRRHGEQQKRPFVYTNYITSLDGRIAIPRPDGAGVMLPAQTINTRDWRLFQELAVQADILITSGRYLRDFTAGTAQDILRVYDDPQFADLKSWRLDRGLAPYPHLAIISGSLNFPIPKELVSEERSVTVFTIREVEQERLQAIESQIGKVIVVGEDSVDGGRLVDSLSALGYRTVYSTAGPKVLHLLLSAGVLDRIYLTFAHRVLGGDPFASIVEGSLLDPSADFRLKTLYFDPFALDGVGQLFASYDSVR
ncbi:MAG: pyrimidine reductase [Anaerolineales bacterium]|nr:pyrimidine reductase [Anaerolineales bacterium]